MPGSLADELKGAPKGKGATQMGGRRKGRKTRKSRKNRNSVKKNVYRRGGMGEDPKHKKP